jgi:hypothetical protein
LGEGGEGAGRGIAEGAEGTQQRRQEDVNPLMGLALPYAEQTALHHLERRGFEVGEQEKEPIFRRRQGAVLVDGKPARRPGFAIEAPRSHMRVKRGLKGREQELKLLEGQAGQIQELCGTGLRIAQP